MEKILKKEAELETKLEQLNVEWEREQKQTKEILQLKRSFENSVTKVIQVYETEWNEFLKKHNWTWETFFADRVSSAVSINKEIYKMTEGMKDFFEKFSHFVEEMKNQNHDKQQLNALLLSSGLLSSQIAELEEKLNRSEREREEAKKKIANLEQEILEFIKAKTNLEIDNEALTKNVAELKTTVNRQKDQISSLQGEQQDLNHQLEILKGELNLTPTSPEPEKQSLREKISFFNNFLKKTQEKSIQLEENIKEEQRKSQVAQQSLLELEEQLQGTSEDNKQQIVKLNQANNDLRKQIKTLENNLKFEKNKVAKLQQELAEKSAEMKKSGVILTKKEQELNQVQQDKQWWVYAFWIVAVVAGLGVGWCIYQEIRKRFF